MQRQRNGAAENCTRPVGEALSLPKRTQLSGSLNGSSFPTQTVGADTLIRVLAEIRGYGRILSAPTRAHPLKLHFYRNAVHLLLRIIAEQGLNAFVKF